MAEQNRRQHIRFRDPENLVLNLIRDKKSGKDGIFKAMIVNESYKGIACVFVGPQGFKKGDHIYWVETSNIQTRCTVVRCKELEESVYSLALRIEE